MLSGAVAHLAPTPEPKEIGKVVRCEKTACRDLCGGKEGNPLPYRDVRAETRRKDAGQRRLGEKTGGEGDG